ncbi:MAG TPA: 16S rRNA (cytosine(1402)-N(4))-methyltransferase RsmH [Bacteroidota bacterium]|nr:16S rRNA (cytosine(1402)-N(4))-methyltransferase RsmH [Bacteroidota bacterium]
MVETRSYHTPVLLQEVLAILLTNKQGCYVDGTLGGGGHAESILDSLETPGILIGIDADDDAIRTASERLKKFGARVYMVKDNFKNLPFVLSSAGIKCVHGILLDLGVSSFQLDEPKKGFSFRGNDRLDMRMNGDQVFDAHAMVNTYDEQQLADVVWKYGEEQQSRRIAKAIVRARSDKSIDTTSELASIVEKTVGTRFLNKSLARVFQAIRIEVNNELENLTAALRNGINCLVPGGRLVVISYHSLEDRIVKDMFRAASATSIPSGNKFQPDVAIQPSMNVLTKKPILASEYEIKNNPRARSAKMRVAEKL